MPPTIDILGIRHHGPGSARMVVAALRKLKPDAVLIEGPADTIDEVVERARGIMAEASKIVLGGFEIGTDFEIVRYPDRYIDEAGVDFWNTVTRLAGPVPTSTYVLN